MVMKRARIHRLALLLSIAAFFAPHATAEIYTWVDAQGNTHFGDKPKDEAQARAAQPVQLREGYQPAARTPQEQAAHDNEQRAIRLRNEMHRREAREAQEAARIERSEQKDALCAQYDEDIEALETVEIENGKRVLVYVEDEDGRPVSSDRQREVIEELKASRAQAGCT